MKQNNKQVIFYSAEKDGFLKSYKDRGSLVFEATFTDRLRDALYLPVEPYEEQKTEIDKLAEAFDCEVLIVEAEYNLTKVDGSDFEHTVREPTFEDGFKALLECLAN